MSGGGVDRRRRSSAQPAGETEPLEAHDEPLARVVVPPAHAVAEVEREPVVVAVVPLTERDERGDGAVASRGALVEGAPAEEMGERIDAEGRLQQHRGP